MQSTTPDNDTPRSFEVKLQQRQQLQARPLETVPAHAMHDPHNTLPNTPLAASTVSFILGIVFTLGLALFLSGSLDGHWWATYQLGFFVACWSAFHWLEFAVTAGWNREKLTIDSFLLTNGAQYHIANSVAVAEYLITLYFWPSSKAHTKLCIAGMVLTLTGQLLRSMAMIHAAANFSHSIAFQKLEKHALVTDGIYRYFRHPSYTGFFYWGLGTQIALLNPITFLVFVVVLWRFFYKRIQTEEKLLVKFFGNDYVEYRRTVGTKIPFIS